MLSVCFCHPELDSGSSISNLNIWFLIIGIYLLLVSCLSAGKAGILDIVSTGSKPP